MAPGDHQPGDILEGRYRLTERLGRGGFGDVWRADELLPDGSPLREVALKLLRPHAAGQDWAAEARIIASLRHPALVTIYAAGELALVRTTPFVAMELLEGESLQRFVRGPAKRTVAWRRVLSWSRQAAAALDTIHAAGVVHLDLKPANLFLADGELKVLDFGIARQDTLTAANAPVEEHGDLSTAAFLVEREQRQSSVGQGSAAASPYAFGTPGFMAPEIIEGGEATAAADAYALAALIVQLVTGRLPQQVGEAPADEATWTGEASLQGWVAEVQAATLRGDLRDLHADGRLPSALTSLCERWLSLDPVARELEPGRMREALDMIWRCPHESDTDNPYRGLEPYRFVDEGRLHGRDAEIARLGRELVSVPTLVFQGATGTGLTSLAVAGVVPAAAKAFADDRDDWLVLFVSFGRDAEQTPDIQLRIAITAFLNEQRAPVDDDAVSALLDWIEHARVGVVVVLDELHDVLVSEPSGRRALVSLFEKDASVAAGIRVLATLRSGAVPDLLATDDLGPRVRPWLRFIGPPQTGTVDELVLGPARAAGRRLVDPEAITKELRAELDEDGSRLGLVSVALERLWDADPDGPLSAKHWWDRGGLVGHLRAHADATLAMLSLEDREVADAILLRLVSVHGEPVEAELEDVMETVGPNGPRVVDALGRARLVVDSGTTLRLAHPALVDGWPRLHDLRLRHLDRLGMLEEIREATRRWQLAGQARDLIWPPARLREVARRHDELAGDLGEDEVAFLEAGRRAQRLGWALRAVAFLAVVAFMVALGWVERTLDRRAQQQAEELALERERWMVAHMVTRSRRSDDPYLQTALLVGAMAAGSSEDPALPLELAEAARNLPTAKFLTLAPVSQVAFPWGPRWLTGLRGTEVMILDFEPPAGEGFAPVAFRFAPHDAGVYDLVPLPFDTAFVTRGLDGEVAVWRLMEEGRLELAARAPMTCLRGLSPVLVAERAPVIACTTERGVALWDLRRPHDVAVDPFMGRGLHVSPDGRWLAATRLDELLLWSPSSARRNMISIDDAPKVARFSPRDEVVAVVGADRLEILDLRSDPPVRRHEATLEPGEPVDARWGPSGVDLAVCDFHGAGHWYYLRRGARADDDLPPAPSRRPCRAVSAAWPRPLLDPRDYGPAIAGADVGPRLFEGGWQLESGRLLSRDLVLFDPDDRRLRALLHADVSSAEPEPLGVSVTAVARDEDQVAWGVGDTIRLVGADGEELLRRPGKLLGHCPDGRFVGLRAEERSWTLFGLRHDVTIATIPREPAFVVGLDPTCKRLYLQGHEGRLGSVALDEPEAIEWSANPLGGYVYDARPSAGWERTPPGLWLATSDGAIHRLDGASGELTAYGSATPRAHAMADGARAGELLLADATGLSLRDASGARTPVLEPMPGRAWSDLRVLPSGAVIGAWAHGVAIIDPKRRELSSELDTPAFGRLADWDPQGSVLVWPFAFMGGPRGFVIPVGDTLARRVGEAASNLRAELTDAGPRILLR